MKKIEAEMIVPEESRVMVEYLDRILDSDKPVTGKMIFGSAKVEGESHFVVDIFVFETGFEKHIDLKITPEHADVFYEVFLNDLLDNFLEHETKGVTKYMDIPYFTGRFTGVMAVNSNQSRIEIRFNKKGQNFDELIEDYNKRIDDYTKKVGQGKRR